MSIHKVADNVHAWWIMMTAMSVSEALMMMLLAFPASYIPLAWSVEADAGVCFGVVSTQYVNGIMPHYTTDLQRRSVEIRLDGQHTHGVRV